MAYRDTFVNTQFFILVTGLCPGAAPIVTKLVTIGANQVFEAVTKIDIPSSFLAMPRLELVGAVHFRLGFPVQK